jgi:hypothetical protein
MEYDDAFDHGPEAAPGMGLRVAGFLAATAGALGIGVGAVLDWVTVGLREIGVETAFPGVDLTEGKIAIALAVVMLIAVLVARAGVGGARRVAAVIVLVAALGAVATAGAFLATVSSRYSAVDAGETAEGLAEELGLPVETVRQQLVESAEVLGDYTDAGPGVYVTLAGGVVGFAGGLLTLVWASRRTRNRAAPSTGDVDPNSA